MAEHTFVIAEAGVNHNGSLDLALKLADVAAAAGADAVKFQTFKAAKLVTAAAAKADYQVANMKEGGTQLGMLQRLELSDRLPLANRLVRRHEFAGDRAYPLMIWYGLEPAVPGRESEPWVELLRAVRVPVVGRLLSRRLTEEIDARPELLDSLVGLLLAPADTLAGNGREIGRAHV